jgi:hypothetical protein
MTSTLNVLVLSPSECLAENFILAAKKKYVVDGEVIFMFQVNESPTRYSVNFLKKRIPTKAKVSDSESPNIHGIVMVYDHDSKGGCDEVNTVLSRLNDSTTKVLSLLWLSLTFSMFSSMMKDLVSNKINIRI